MSSIVFDEVVGSVGPGVAPAQASAAEEEAQPPPPEPDPERLRAELALLTRREARLFAD